MTNPEFDALRQENERLKAWLGVIASPQGHEQSQGGMAQKALDGEPVPPDPWDDPHFPKGTETHEIFAHLRSVHANRAPWGNAFIDDFGHEYPPRVVGVHAWCHREDSVEEYRQPELPESPQQLTNEDDVYSEFSIGDHIEAGGFNGRIKRIEGNCAVIEPYDRFSSCRVIPINELTRSDS